MCKADSSEILSSFEVVLPPSILDTCQRLRPGISTCFLAVNKQEGTSSQITVAKQNDKSVVLRVAVMALGKSRREKKIIGAAETAHTTEPEYEEQMMEQGELSFQQEDLEGSPEIVGKVMPPVRKKPGPAFTKKPGYRKLQQPKPTLEPSQEETSPDTMPKLQKALATYQNMHRPSTIVSVKKTKVDSGKGRARYIPTKMKPPTLEKSQYLPMATKQPAVSRFAKTQAAIAAIEAANKKTPTYIGNLGSRRIPEMHVPPPRPRMMPVLQRENNIATGNYETSAKVPAGRGKHKRPTQPYGMPRPAGMNKSLTKMWSQKKKRGPKKGASSISSSISDTTAPTTEIIMEGGVSEPFEISGSESTIIITVNEGKITKPLQKTEILHHKKRWAAANAKCEANEEEEQEESEEEEGVLKFEDAEVSLNSTADGTPVPRKRKRGPKKPKCRLCSTKFMEYHYLFRHVQRKHKTNEGEFYLEEVRALVKYSCPSCSQDFPSEEELSEHTKEGCQGPEPPSLSECHMTPVSQATDRESQSEQPQTLQETLPGSGPQKVLDNKTKLQKHKIMRGEYRHTCKYCKKGFHLQDIMTKHIQAVHEKNKGRKHKCPRCGKQFNLKSTMLQHFQGTHLKQMPYHCPMCQTGFRRMKTLTSHVEKCKIGESNQKEQPKVQASATVEENGS